MISHDHPRFSDPEFRPYHGGFACEEMPFQRCIGCRESVPMDGLERGYCEYCRENCPICGDWLAGEDETEVNGQRAHASCAEDYSERIKESA